MLGLAIHYYIVVYHKNNCCLFIAYGDLWIHGGGNSGQLQIQNSNGQWAAICDAGFDDDDGDVACRQLGYLRSSNVYTYGYVYVITAVFNRDGKCYTIVVITE